MNIKHVFYWGVGALALIALAGSQAMAPVAKGLAVLLIVGVLLTHYQEYITYFNQATPTKK